MNILLNILTLPNNLLLIRNRLKKDSITKLDISSNDYNIYFIIEYTVIIMSTVSKLNQKDEYTAIK